MADIFNMTDAWNDAGVTFSAIKMDVTDTASAAGSNLLDLQVGGSSKFAVTKGGQVKAVDGEVNTNAYGFSGEMTVGISRNGSYLNFQGGISNRWGAAFRDDNNVGIIVASDLPFSWLPTNETPGLAFPDLRLYRDAANTLAQRNGTNAQTQRIYNTGDSINGEWAKAGWNANVFEIKPEAAGTGTTRVLHISGLPTSDPAISGVLWNDAGTVKVSA